MAKTGFQIKGLSKVLSKIKEYPEQVKKEVDHLLGTEAQKMEAAAVNDAPRNAGILVGRISAERKGDMHYTVVAASAYAVYMEFGTKKKFNNPYPSLSGYVGQFQGKGEGSAEEFLKQIKEWVKKKGIRIDNAATYKSGKKKGQNKQLSYEETAYFIYHFIMLNGVNPHPFFFKHYFVASENITKGIRNILKDYKGK